MAHMKESQTGCLASIRWRRKEGRRLKPERTCSTGEIKEKRATSEGFLEEGE
jgi:hypothetical protein